MYLFSTVPLRIIITRSSQCCPNSQSKGSCRHVKEHMECWKDTLQESHRRLIFACQLLEPKVEPAHVDMHICIMNLVTGRHGLCVAMKRPALLLSESPSVPMPASSHAATRSINLWANLIAAFNFLHGPRPSFLCNWRFDVLVSCVPALGSTSTASTVWKEQGEESSG